MRKFIYNLEEFRNPTYILPTIDKRYDFVGNKVLIVGLDGATFDLILPWIEHGLLPNMKYLVQHGSWSQLISTIPMFTATAWSSFATGLNPDNHGILGFFTREFPWNLRIVTSKDRKGEEFWVYLSKFGKKVIVLNVPLTYPPKKVNGILISGFPTPLSADDYAYPPRIIEEIKSVLKEDYEVDISITYEEGLEEEFIQEVRRITEKQFKSAYYLLNKYPWDLFVIVFNGTDYLQHALWKYIDKNHPFHNKALSEKYYQALLEYYQYIDYIIGEFIKCLPKNAYIIIMSDHGFGPLYKFIHLNWWLLKNGYLKLKRDPITTMKLLLYHLGITPDRIFKLLLLLHLTKIRRRMGFQGSHKLLARVFLSFKDVDWDKTIAHSLGSMGLIYLNKKVIRKNNMSPGDVIRELVEKLKRLKDPETNESPFEKILLKRDVYRGRLVDNMPDIILVPKAYYMGFEEYEFASNKVITIAKGISGTHRREGIFIIYGDNIKRGYKLTNKPHIIDIMPTVLYLMNVPIPRNIDGRVIFEVFTSFIGKEDEIHTI